MFIEFPTKWFDMKKTFIAIITYFILLFSCTKEPAAPNDDVIIASKPGGTPSPPPNDLIWQNCVGTVLDDNGFGIAEVLGSGYFVSGSSNNRADALVAKIRTSSNWSTSFGGNGIDEANAVVATSDGGCLVAGLTNSTDINGYSGSSDVLLAKLSSSGDVQWIRAIGTSASEQASKLIKTSDGGFALCGYSNEHMLVIKLKPFVENIIDQEQANVNENLVEWRHDVRVDQNTSNHGNGITEEYGILYLTGVGWNSNSQRHSYLYLKMKVSDGEILISKGIYPGQGSHYSLALCRNLSNNGSILAGRTACDAFVMEVDENGDPVGTTKVFGGAGCLDGFWGITKTTDGYMLAGSTNSKNGDIVGAKGGKDVWVLRLDASLNKIISYNFGGKNDDEGRFIIRKGSTNEYAVVGATKSISGDVSGNNGGFDLWSFGIQLH